MNYAKIVPPDSFIGQYLQAASVLETPQSYDFWGAMWVLGTCCGRDVFVPRPMAPVYMNWYIMFVAESGVTRKSTAVRMARTTAGHMVNDFVEGRATPEYLESVLVRQPHMPIAVNELVTFLGRESYIIELPALLTDLFDCPETRGGGGTMTRGERMIHNPYVTFISASTPSWLCNSVNPTVVEGGFTSRCLFVHEERPKKRVAWPQGMVVTHVTQTLRETVRNAQKLRTIQLHDGGMRKFSNWYNRRDTSSLEPFVASFNSREDGHVLRAAACLAINDGSYAIESRHILNASRVIQAAKVGAIHIFQDSRKVIKAAQGIDKVIAALIEAGSIGITRNRLYLAARYYIHKEDFEMLMELMMEMGMVNGFVEHTGKRGKKATRYIRTDRITSKTKLEQIRDAFT